MFDHVTIRVFDLQASRQFYETVLDALGIATTYSDDRLVEWDDFSLAPASDDKPSTRRLHVGFVAPSRAQVDEFWRIGVEASGNRRFVGVPVTAASRAGREVGLGVSRRPSARSAPCWKSCFA